MKDDKDKVYFSDTEYVEKAYHTSEVATMLDLAVPTIRRYCQFLEKQGYTFLRGKATGQHKARLFLDKDIQALRYLKDIREKGNMTVEQATSVVVQRFGEKAIQPIRSGDIQTSDDSDRRYGELKELFEQQNDLIKMLSEQVNEQQQYIDDHFTKQNERLEQRDEALMQTLKELQETRQQENKGFFSRLFSKR